MDDRTDRLSGKVAEVVDSTDRVREAVEADIPRIVEMGMRSLRDGPYGEHIGANPEHGKAFAGDMVRGQNSIVLLYERGGRVEGLLAFIVFPHFFSGERTAQEIMWWVEPEARKGSSFSRIPAFMLFREAERLAKEMGAMQMQFTAPTPAIGKLYERAGYRQIEIGYQRTL